MAEPEHNFAYHPSVASWVQSTVLAQFDDTSDEAAEQTPDEFYKSTSTHANIVNSQPSAMASTRQRQQTPNGATRSSAKASVRSVSGSVTSTSSTPRSGPQVPANRPTVRSLAQKFNQPSSSADSSPLSSRPRTVRPPPTTKEPPSYGGYKFNTLKARERPQPAPASPASTRRSNGVRSSLGQQPSASPARSKVSSPVREPIRQPFFGEVVGEQSASTPGFGIPSAEESSSLSAPLTVKLVTEDVQETPDSDVTSAKPLAEKVTPQSPRASDSVTPHRRSPPSRIPVAKRRQSASSCSSTSTRSSRFNSARPVGYSRTSPTQTARRPAGKAGAMSPNSKAAKQPTLQAVSYRGYRERGKPSQDASNGPSVSAVITAPPPPTSPRLRNSRERQLVHETPGSVSRSGDPHAPEDYFSDENGNFKSNGNMPSSPYRSQMNDTEAVDSKLSVKLVVASPERNNDADVGEPPQSNESVVNGRNLGVQPMQLPSLSLTTDTSQASLADQRSSTGTNFEFDESPILGMPGSFLTTPPLAQANPPTEPSRLVTQRTQSPSPSPQDELLQARAFEPASRNRLSRVISASELQDAPSEIGYRESIPIMLGTDRTDRWDADSNHSWEASFENPAQRGVRRVDFPGTNFHLELPLQGALRPDQSSSMADSPTEYRRRRPSDMLDPGAYTPTSRDAYSVIKSVLNEYHRADVITPDMASESKEQVQRVSPMIAQHRDWASKEATETYLARLLSDATGGGEGPGEDSVEVAAPTQPPNRIARKEVPAMSIRALDADPEEPVVGGTAIIFPTESARYSRDSQNSTRSTATTIWEGHGRPDSSSELPHNVTHWSRASHQQPQVKRYYSQPRTNDEQTHLPTSAEPPTMPRYSLLGKHNDDPKPKPKDDPKPKPRKSFEWGPYPPGHVYQSPCKSTPQPTHQSAPQPSHQSVPQPAHQSVPQPSHQSAPPRPPYSPPPPPTQGTTNDVLYNALDQLNLQSVRDAGEPVDQLQHPAVLQADSASPEQVSMLERTPTTERTPTPEAVVATPPAGAGASTTELTELEKAIKQVQKRYRVIEELTKTEHSFCVDMMVAHQIFENTSKEVLSDAESRLLFGNCKDVESFSHTLWKSLKDAIRPVVNQASPDENSEVKYNEFLCCTPENDREVRIGAVMLAATKKMERVYQTYYLNYTDASDFIRLNLQNPELLGWVAACFNHCPNLTTAWDLDSLLVKPCQRMLKYPILLDDLIAKTALDHPDLADLKKASRAIKDVAGRIEVCKSRQQTLRAAAQEGKKEKKKGSFGNNIIRALIPNKEKNRIMQEAASALADDQEYEKISQKFGGHFFQIQITIRDFEQYLDSVTDQLMQLNSMMLGFVTVSETGLSANAEMESTWRRWAQAHTQLQAQALDDHRNLIRERVMKPICAVWELWIQPQKHMEYRKKLAIPYNKYRQQLERKERVDPEKYQTNLQHFVAVNDSLKLELPMLYEKTKKVIRLTEIIFIGLQKEWYKTCSRKILPLLESEPQHTTSMQYDFKVYVDRFRSDYRKQEERAKGLAIVNHDLLDKMSTFTSPVNAFYPDDSSSRKSSSRRTESISSDYSIVEQQQQQRAQSMAEQQRPRNSGGYGSTSRSNIRSFEDQARQGAPPATPFNGVGSYHGPPVTPGTATPTLTPHVEARERTERTMERTERMLAPSVDSVASEFTPRTLTPAESADVEERFKRVKKKIEQLTGQSAQSEPSEATIPPQVSEVPAISWRPSKTRRPSGNAPAIDSLRPSRNTTGFTDSLRPSSNASGTFDSFLDHAYAQPPSVGASFLNPTLPNTLTNTLASLSVAASTPNSSRTSGVFSSALPMSDNRNPEYFPVTPSGEAESDVEVLFLAASLFEFNIAHDRREGGIPYLVYVPGEIFDVIGMKGELWLARNQDDPQKMVGWIWEKHFARILPEEGLGA